MDNQTKWEHLIERIEELEFQFRNLINIFDNVVDRKIVKMLEEKEEQEKENNDTTR